jgi:hypothetical protein
VLALTLGALACEPTVEHYGDYDRDHFDHNRYYHEDQYDGNIYRSNRPCRVAKGFEDLPRSFLKKTTDHKTSIIGDL